jgi:hypothetical protein
MPGRPATSIVMAMSVRRSATMTKWWAVVVIGAAVALMMAWLGRQAGVPAATLLTIGAAVAALSWVVVLVTVPWNLYFAARRVVVDVAVSRARGIEVPPGNESEAALIARRMLRFAIGAHVGTAAVTATAAYLSDVPAGYYVAGFYLLSTVVRPAGAYFAHQRLRILTLGRETTHPRDDVVTLRAEVTSLADSFKDFRTDVSRTQYATADDLARLHHAVDGMARRVDAALDGVSDHRELLAGIRALARMFRSEPA